MTTSMISLLSLTLRISFLPLQIPPEWTEQFASGIQTIAVIQVGHGLLQLGSCKNIPEDLRFVLSIRQAFAFLGYQSGFYLSQLFSSSSDSNSPSPFSVTSPVGEPRYKQALPRPPPLLYNWNHQQSLGIITYGGGFNPADHIAALHGGSKDDGQTLLPMQHPSSGAPVNDMIADHDPDVKWPNGLSFTSTIGRVDDSKLRFGGGGGVEEESSKSISEDQGIDKQI